MSSAAPASEVKSICFDLDFDGAAPSDPGGPASDASSSMVFHSPQASQRPAHFP
jgi:hypothetical protein